MYTICLGLFVLEHIDIVNIKGILEDFLNISISKFNNFVNFWVSGLGAFLFLVISVIKTKLFILGFCLYFLTCLYFSCKSKKLHFVGVFTFIKYLFTSLVLLTVISITIHSLIYFGIDKWIYNCPKDIFYHFVLFIFVSYCLTINWNLYNLFSIFLRGIFIYILRLSLIFIFPSLESFLTLNLLFILLPGLDLIIQELFQSINLRLDNFVFMYSSWWNNPGPSMGGNEPGGSNNGGNNGGNNSGTSYYIDGDRDNLNDINDPLDHHGCTDLITLRRWADFWGIPRENIALDPSVFYSSPVYGSTYAKAICRPFVLPIKGDDLVFLSKIMDTTYILPVSKLRAVPLLTNASITIFNFSYIPNLDDMSFTAVKYSTGQGLNGEGYLTVHSVIRIAPYRKSNTLWINIDGDNKELYDYSNMNHWGKDLYFKKALLDPKSPWIKLGKTNDFINLKEDKQITSANFMANSVIFKPYVPQISAAFRAERYKLAPNLITYLDIKAKIPS